MYSRFGLRKSHLVMGHQWRRATAMVPFQEIDKSNHRQLQCPHQSFATEFIRLTFIRDQNTHSNANDLSICFEIKFHDFMKSARNVCVFFACIKYKLYCYY